MDVIGDTNTSNYINIFYCKLCDFKCIKKGDWNRHIVTEKHLVTNGDKCHFLGDNKTSYDCVVCEKKYFSRNGLWKHKKICCKNINNSDKPIPITTKLIMELIKDNQDMKQLIIEQNNKMNNTMNNLKNGTNTNITNNNYTNNNNNKIFNLQVFLNETCKDAMNMTDFIESIKIQLSDLEKMGDIGYVQGLSNIITTNLNILDITQRPVHCTDQKRETIYIKNDNLWEKEDDNKTKLRKAINKIAYKNIKLLPQYREKYPDYKNSSLKSSDIYDKLVIEAMGGIGDNDFQKETKIIHNISKYITINK